MTDTELIMSKGSGVAAVTYYFYNLVRCELSVEADGNLLWGRYLVKSNGFVLSLLR